MKSIESPLHPSNDSRLLERHSWYGKNPANDPEYIFRLAEKMESDSQLRDVVHQKFLDGDLSFLMHDGQLKVNRVLEDNPTEVEFLILSSRQLGKSFITLLKAIEHLAKPFGKRNPLVRIFCETDAQIRDIVQDNMNLILPLAPPGFIVRTKSEKRYKIGCGELRLGIMAGAHVHGRRGGNATLIVTEESGFSPSESFKDAVNNVLGPQLLRSGGKVIHVTTSSSDELHYVHDVIQKKCEEAGTLVNLTIYDNPQLPDSSIIKAFERIWDGTTEGWQREYLCEVIRSTMLTVVPEFDASLINETEAPTHANWITSVDFGGTRDKHACLLGYYDFHNAKTIITAEALLPINTGTDTIVEATEGLESNFMCKTVVGHTRKVDAPGQLLVDLRASGFQCQLPSKAAGSFEAGINMLRLAVVNNTLEIHPRCTNLIKALKYGKLNKSRTDYERHAEFGHLDIVAALIYLLRHVNTVNPYPSHLGKSRQSHHIHSDSDSSSGIEALLNI